MMIDSQTHKENRSVWFGDIPNNWKISKLKYVVNIYTGNSLNDIEKSNFSTDDILEKNGYNYISSKDIDVNNNTCNYDTGLFIPASETRYKIAPRASTLLCIEGGSAGKKLTYTTEDVCFVNKLACFNSKFDINSKYVYFYLQSFEFKNQFQGALSGLIGGVSLTNLNDFEIPVPPLPEQTQIADFLDRKTAQIDEIIAKKEKMLTLLDEKKKAVINEAVTKGLNPNAKMKDSGIEWIGEIPENWEIIPLKYVAEFKTGNRDTIHREDDGVYPFFVRSPKIERINSYSFDGEAILMAGDGVGAGKVFHYFEGKFDYHQRVYNIHNFKKVSAKFIYYFMSELFVNIMDQMSAKNTVDSVRLPMIESFPVPVFDLKEQEEIVNFILESNKKIVKILDKINLQIEKLKEYRQSLISEAVTGKIDVKNYN